MKAVPATIVLNARGEPITMTPGPCLWCGQWVTEGRDEAGATRGIDPCWNVDGDFGCDESPESSDEGVGDHARPYDLAVRISAGRLFHLLTGGIERETST